MIIITGWFCQRKTEKFKKYNIDKKKYFQIPYFIIKEEPKSISTIQDNSVKKYVKNELYYRGIWNGIYAISDSYRTHVVKHV